MNSMRTVSLAATCSLAVVLMGGCEKGADLDFSGKTWVGSPSGSVAAGAAIHSPDGSLYARVVASDAANGAKVLEVRASGTDLLLASFGVSDCKGLAWSPDGSVIAGMYHFGHLAANHVVWFMSATTGAIVDRTEFRVETWMHILRYTDDGTALVVENSSEVRTVPL